MAKIGGDGASGGGIGDQLFTFEPLSISVDPGGGSDPTSPVRIVTQAQATAQGAFATIRAALDALPDGIFHDVSIALADGAHSADASTFANMDRFGVKFTGYDPAQRDADEFHVNTSIRVVSASGNVLAAGSTDNMTCVVPANTRQIELASDPSYSVDQFAGFFLLVVSGTGAGSHRAIRSHSGTTFSIATALTTDATSVVRIVQPAATLTFSDPDTTLYAIGHSIDLASTSRVKLRFHAVDITAATGALVVNYPTSLAAGARVLGFTVFVYGFLLLQHVIFDGTGGGSSSGLLIAYGAIRSNGTTASWLIRQGPGWGLTLWGRADLNQKASGYMFAGAIDDCPSGAIRVRRPITFLHFDSSSGYFGSVGCPVFLLIEQGADVVIDENDARYEVTVTGTDEISLDGDGYSIADLSTDVPYIQGLEGSSIRREA